METFYFCFSTLLVLIVFNLTKRLLSPNSKAPNLPPSPFPSLPLIGHLYLLNHPFHKALAKISTKYGPILYLKLGSRPVLLVSSPSAAEACLVQNDVVFANRPPLLAGKHFGYNFTNLVWASYGDHFKNLRRVISTELLSSKRNHVLSCIRNDEIKGFLHGLFEKEKTDGVLDIQSSIFELAFNVTTRIVTGQRYYGEKVDNLKEAEMFKEMTSEVLKVSAQSMMLDFLPFTRFFGMGKIEKKLIQVQEKKEALVQSLMDKYRSMESEAGNKNFVQVLLDLQNEEPERYPDKVINGLIAVLYQASTDTTAVTMERAFSLMLSHPKVIEKAQAEIDQVIGNNRVMDDSDVAQLPYLRSIIKETMRLHPAIPLLIPHYSSRACTVEGFHIPQNTMLLVNAWGIHHDPKFWVEPEKFLPERFEGLEGAKDDFRFMPFGSGRRKCPGENLAMRNMGLALGSLLQCFHWERISEEMDTCESSGYLASMVQPMKVKYTSRQNMAIHFS